MTTDEPRPSEPSHENASSERPTTLLMRISNRMVQYQKEFFGKGPTSAKSYIFDDMLFIVMRGGFTTAEMTMLEFGQGDLVRQFRQIFENEMGERLIDMVEDLTGRRVLTYQSQVLFDPNVVIEMFIFDAADASGAAEATARGQIRGEEVGAATDAEELDAAIEPGSTVKREP